MKYVGYFAKGILATAICFLTALSTALPGGVTGQEWVTIALGTLTAAAAVVGVGNAAKPVKP